jgi:hypothetical protein
VDDDLGDGSSAQDRGPPIFLHILMPLCAGNLEQRLHDLRQSGTDFSKSANHWLWVHDVLRQLMDGLHFLHLNGSRPFLLTNISGDRCYDFLKYFRRKI